mmetsp:Transcript_71049/g.200424  ORF Transcript_71049/g.200424 Transcript_71049/m.200424 type:complete len:548 (-) Transcript_71049:56-1699(-)
MPDHGAVAAADAVGGAYARIASEHTDGSVREDASAAVVAARFDNTGVSAEGSSEGGWEAEEEEEEQHQEEDAGQQEDGGQQEEQQQHEDAEEEQEIVITDAGVGASGSSLSVSGVLAGSSSLACGLGKLPTVGGSGRAFSLGTSPGIGSGLEGRGGDGGLVVIVHGRQAANGISTGGADCSGPESSDFESLSAVSSEVSEIPEAIVEDSSDSESTGLGDAPLHGHRAFTAAAAARAAALRLTGDVSGTLMSAWGGAADSFLQQQLQSPPWLLLGESPRPTPIAAWTAPAWTLGPSPSAPLLHNMATASAAVIGTELSVGTVSSLPRTPVRRARVRGTVCLPTSARTSEDRTSRPHLQHYQSHPQLRQRPTTTPLGMRRGEGGGIADAVAMPSPEGEGRSRLEVAEQRALRLEEALDEERAAREAEMARQERDAADRQAILQALDHDRAELAALYREAHMELHRLRTDLSERTMEVEELRREQEQLRYEVMRRPAQSTCVVCLDLPASVACVPCGHLSLCEACTGRLRGRQCPVCRRPVATVLRIFAC